MHANTRLYNQTQRKNRRTKQFERERNDKHFHGKDGSRHQKNKKLAEVRRNEVDAE